LLLRETDLDDTVRPPINAAEASKLLEHIEKWKGKVSKQWKARANAHQQAIEKGDPYGYAKVFKGLSKLEQEGNLRSLDRAHLKLSTQLLVEELANALGKSQEEALDQIEKIA
jgi:RNA polymerase-interacting CarD/CdnL/TRCF family regulator